MAEVEPHLCADIDTWNSFQHCSAAVKERLVALYSVDRSAFDFRELEKITSYECNI
jgi:hypothetical protein